MAYTPIDKGENFFNSKLYTGTGSSNAQTGIGFRPDWVWLKCRSGDKHNNLYDVIRGATKEIYSNLTNDEDTDAQSLKSFNSDGFTVGTGADQNENNATYVAWNWKAAGSNPAKTYVVKVVSDGGNKYRLDDFAANAVTLELSEGGTFTFDQSDSSNNGHPLRFSTTSNGTHGGGSIYTTGVTVSGTPGQAGAKTVIIVAASAPTLYYFCTVHSGMGGQANTPVTNSFTDLDGSIQSNISPATTFSIVKYTATGSNATVGHGLGAVPKMIIVKDYKDTGGSNWAVYHHSIGNTEFLELNSNAAKDTSSGLWNNTTPTSSVFTIGTNSRVNNSGNDTIAYCFPEVQGFSKMGSYLGNGNADGPFVYTGFKPAWIMIKRAIGGTDNWVMFDNKRSPFNEVNENLVANASSPTNTGIKIDMLSNGFKCKVTEGNTNVSGNTYIYMAFAENPFVSAAKIPVTAR